MTGNRIRDSKRNPFFQVKVNAFQQVHSVFRSHTYHTGYKILHIAPAFKNYSLWGRMGISPNFFARISNFALYINLQLFQYPLRFAHLSGFYIRNDYGISINRIGQR